MTIFALNQILQKMSHLTKEQRYTIFVMKQQSFRNNQIANVIGKDKYVISRELKRNCDKADNIKPSLHNVNMNEEWKRSQSSSSSQKSYAYL